MSLVYPIENHYDSNSDSDMIDDDIIFISSSSSTKEVIPLAVEVAVEVGVESEPIPEFKIVIETPKKRVHKKKALLDFSPNKRRRQSKPKEVPIISVVGQVAPTVAPIQKNNFAKHIKKNSISSSSISSSRSSMVGGTTRILVEPKKYTVPKIAPAVSYKKTILQKFNSDISRVNQLVSNRKNIAITNLSSNEELLVYKKTLLTKYYIRYHKINFAILCKTQKLEYLKQQLSIYKNGSGAGTGSGTDSGNCAPQHKVGERISISDTLNMLKRVDNGALTHELLTYAINMHNAECTKLRSLTQSHSDIWKMITVLNTQIRELKSELKIL